MSDPPANPKEVASVPTHEHEFDHLYRPAYSDMPQTYMAGSEHFKCRGCGFTVTPLNAQDFPMLRFTLEARAGR